MPQVNSSSWLFESLLFLLLILSTWVSRSSDVSLFVSLNSMNFKCFSYDFIF